jgi:hypothetical protein
MSDDDVIRVGARLPRIGSVRPVDGWRLSIRWDQGAHAHGVDIVDLEPALQRFKVYRALLESPALFRAAHVDDYGHAIVWTNEIDMSAGMLERLALKTFQAETV